MAFSLSSYANICEKFCSFLYFTTFPFITFVAQNSEKIIVTFKMNFSESLRWGKQQTRGSLTGYYSKKQEHNLELSVCLVPFHFHRLFLHICLFSDFVGKVVIVVGGGIGVSFESVN